MSRPLLAGLAFAFLLPACASSGSTPQNPATGAPVTAAQTKSAPRSTTDVLIGADIVATGVNNVYEGIQRLRPSFYRARSVSGGRSGSAGPQVMIDDASRTVDDLRSLPPAQIDFVRYFDVDEANGRFGSAAPVIYVVTIGHTPRIPLRR